MLDLAIRGALVYDGSGLPGFPSDIGIKDGIIAKVGQCGPARDELYAAGLVLSPGFIDTHAHSEFTLLADPRAEAKLAQGVTTEINGNCGLSGGPLVGPAMERREDDLKALGITERWESLADFLCLLESRKPGINFATLVGHGNIRASVMGYADRKPSQEEMARMKALLLRALSEGGIGLSTGLIYPPGVYSDIDELVELSASGLDALGDAFIYATHMRSEGERLIEAIEETLDIGQRAGCRVHVSHIKTGGRQNWPKAGRVIKLLDAARAKGQGVSSDRYPYTASSTELDSLLPAWMYEGGNDEELMRLGSADIRKRLRSEMPWDDEAAGTVFVSTVERYQDRWMEGMSMRDIALRYGMDVFDMLFEVLVSNRLMVGAVFHSMSTENLERFLGLPYCMPGTDSSARCFDGPTAKGKPHPRGFGSFPRFISQWKGPLEEAIRKCTGLPASIFGLGRRGLLREGYHADMVVFDPARIKDTATYDNPMQRPEGIEHVLVNSVFALREGRPTGARAGRVLRQHAQAA